MHEFFRIKIYHRMCGGSDERSGVKSMTFGVRAVWSVNGSADLVRFIEVDLDSNLHLLQLHHI